MSFNDPVIQVLLSIIRGLAVLAVALILARFVKRWTIRAASRGRLNLHIATLLGNLARVAVVTVGIVTALPAFGVDWPGLLTVMGAAGLALSLSMQDLLKNVVAGIYILVEQPFRIGDRISVKDVTGVVHSIELRTTILTTEEKLQVVVPNSVVLNEIVTNRSVSDLQRQVMQVRIPMASLSEISEQVSAALKENSDVAASPSPVVALEKVIEGIARLRVEFWVPASKRIATASMVAEALQALFPEANITVVRPLASGEK
jgi:small conductance mechanosensitive channel